MPSPRIHPIQPYEMDPITKELLAGVREPDGIDATNAFATLVRHPTLFRKWTPLGGMFIYRGALSGRDRELLILRTAWQCRSSYNWAQHVVIAEREGISPAEISALLEARERNSWSPRELALLGAADDLHDDAAISDLRWEVLATEYDERQLIEICMLVGFYHMSSFALTSLGVQLDEGLDGLPE
jgi:4-carboxymuconolactone decarboxylase